MQTLSKKGHSLAIAISGIIASMAGISAPTAAHASGFVDDATLTGGVYYFQRERDRKDVTTDKYNTNLSHGTWNAGLLYSSGYAAGIIGLDVGAFGVVDMIDSDSSAHPNEIALSKSKKTYDENWSGDRSGANLYRAAIKVKQGPFWSNIGLIQPSGQTLLGTQWGFYPGTYQGAEVGANFDYGTAGALSMSYMWTNKYHAPWYTEFDGFYQNDKTTKINYLHSVGLKYDFKNSLVLEAAFGQSQGYINQYFAKSSYAFQVAGRPLNASYQFYGSQDKVKDGGVNDLYNGMAWLQAITLGYTVDQLSFRVEGTRVHAPGNQGFFLQRMTPSYASSNGRLDVWWNNRSDFNADGENALFTGVSYDLAKWQLPGFTVGASYVYAWNAKPAAGSTGTTDSLKESAWSLDAGYTIQSGKAKNTNLALHYTNYNNHSNIPSWGGGYGNIFQDEHDVKFIIAAPVSIF